MTDKQIIIDDYFTECTDEGGGTIGYYLIDDTALIKKIREQNEYIKAKEQECERLKDKLNCCFCNPYVESNDIEKQRKCVEVTECFKRQLDQLKAENDTLFKAIEEVNKINKRLEAENEGLKQKVKHYKQIAQHHGNSSVEYTNKSAKFKQTLTEIKVFVMQAKHDYNLPKYLFDTILQKISEVEDEKV